MPARTKRRSQRQYGTYQPALKLAASLPGVHAGAFPGFIEPALATHHDRSPSGDRWVHEVKFDGYRLQVHVQEGVVKLLTRRGHDWTTRFGMLAEAAWHLSTHSAVLDGEVIVSTESGHSDFGALEEDLGAGRSDRFVFFAFDLLYLNGWDLRQAGLLDRKHVLAELLSDAPAALRLSEHVEGDGHELYQRACDLELEGIVSKLRDAPYRSGRTSAWVKATCRQRDTFYAVGIARKAGKFDGVYLARRDGDALLYAGKVERGFNDKQVRGLEERLAPYRRRTQPLKRKIKKPKATWFDPAVLVDVEFRALTGERKVRHPSYVGIREDLEPAKERRR
jgi:bifunctional non-homologous end joining protein LigD